jgi:uncharacterized membrane protein YphA (DoxX/SURF4 family)
MKYSRYAPLFARVGVGFVFLIFGIWQLINPQGWLGYVPNFILNSGINPITILLLNGVFDLLIGLGLVLGLFLRIVSLLGIIHLAGISYSLGWNDVAVRDIGLMIVLIAIFLQGPDEFCLSKRA